VNWHKEPVVGFDLETSGVDIETARIVTAALVTYSPTGEHTTRTWVADPGIAIPDEAAKIHGYNTDRARAEGRPAAEVVEEIAEALTAALAAGTPLVAMNARYDCTVLDRELRRHSLKTLQERISGEPSVGPVIDPLILDKQADKYRKGSRRLENLAVHYGVTLNSAHTADADALAAVEVAIAIAEKYPQLQVHPEQLHVWQIRWAAEQAASLQQHLRKLSPYAVVDSEWPMVPLTGERQVRNALADLAQRWESMAPKPPIGDLLVDEVTVAEAFEVAQNHTYRQAAADVRDVLRTGHAPHGLMTDAELEQYGTPEAGR
jgi:DNA polymerase-3 subunit epsilon